FYKAGLAYQAEIPINWCPLEKTGLANEEVVDGKHERCGTLVEKKTLNQWVLKITEYADRLIKDLGDVDYLDRIAVQQVNWIGRSEGAEIEFDLHGISGQADDKHTVTVYTTRPDTLGGATFVVVSPELAQKWLDNGWKASDKVKDYIHKSLNKSELDRQDENREKTGVDSGITAVNPLNNEEVPVWVADYVLGGYGTGAIMAVPAHDERDYEFAKKFKLPIKKAIEPKFIAETGDSAVQPDQDFIKREAVCAVVRNPKTNEYLCISWKEHHMNGLVTGGLEGDEDPVKAAEREIREETGYKNLRFVEDPGIYIHSLFYHRQKKQNRWARFHFLFFELANEETEPVSKKEAALLKPVWKTIDEMRSFFSVVEGTFITNVLDNPNYVYTGEGVVVDTGNKFDGLAGSEARHAIVEYLFKTNKAKHATKYKLRDWIFSRQHYWGEPIPIIHCPKDGAVAVPDKDLPVELPLVDHYEPTETGESPLAAIDDWVNVKCPECGGPAKRETDTMPNWAGSSWYYLRYIDPHNDQEFASQDKLKYWLPVDLYNGGMEHTTLHLLYSRFWHKFLYDQKLVPTPEPYAMRRSHGMILGPDSQKMSKSRGNVINPDSIVESYGADTLRLYEMFMGPFDEMTAWSDERLAGVSRFIHRVWDLSQRLIGNDKQAGAPDGILATEVDRMVHKTLKKVHEDIEGMHFNTMVSALMELSNFLNSREISDRLLKPENADTAQRTVRTLVLMLAPVVPHAAEELWQELGERESVHTAEWPKYDPALIKEELIEIPIQINGKLRATIVVAVDVSDDELEKLAAGQEKVKQHLEGHKILKTVVVSRKLVNFVTDTLEVKATN
ncbi:MAG TPA: class I tRNA ligase family protein, partial [Candidatus Nanoarchaeia archaeon]|nr:class I tRNA ligase family protein [Candidatus Nanoarchaeia archaeon]